MKIVIFPLVSYTTKYTFDTLMGYERPYQQTIQQVFGDARTTQTPYSTSVSPYQIYFTHPHFEGMRLYK
jgi:hypothetical protein